MGTRERLARVALAVAMATGVLVGSGGTAHAAGGPVAIGAGLNDPKNPRIAVLEFLPAKVTVAVGTPVQWQWNGTEPHSVTFLPAGKRPPIDASDLSLFLPSATTGPVDGATAVNSGLQPLGPDAPPPFETTFSKPGTYAYYCVIHPNMKGTVTVKAAGAKVDSAAAVKARRAKEQRAWLAEGRKAYKRFTTTAATRRKVGGRTTWTVQMGTSTKHTDILAFSPTPAKVAAGDAVRFVNSSHAPHTASFFGSGAEPITNPLDPRVAAPSPGPSPQVLSGTGFANTGQLPEDVPKGKHPLSERTFTFTVPKAGTYGYVCILHASSNMTGAITAT